jgi:hypothetical protein
MNYSLTKINANDTIGNNLSALNLNYEKLEYRTNNIITSSIQIFEPLIEYYNFFNSSWKATIDYSYAINAPQRLQTFQTLVQNTSSSWSNPISIIYPKIPRYSSSTFSTEINNAINWFKKTFPIFTTSDPSRPLYVEGTKAFLSCMFHDVSVKVNQTNQAINTANCRSFDRSAAVRCIYTYIRDVFCAGTEVCSRYNGSATRTTYTLRCRYENGTNAINRRGTATIKSFFRDRREHDNLYCVLLEVKNCQWNFIKTI